MNSIVPKLFQLVLFVLTFCLANLVLSEEGECESAAISSPPPEKKLSITPRFICVKGHDYTKIWAVWADVEMIIRTKAGVTVNVVWEKSCTNVKEKYQNQSSSWFRRYFFWRSSHHHEGRTSLSASPYGTNCFAISVDQYGELEVIFHKLRLLYPFVMVVGMFLFYRADAIARSILFYYTAGISIGMIMAVFLLLFVISKFIPQRGIGYAFMFCGSSIVIYFFQLVQEQIFSGNFADIKIFYAYFILAGIISFLYCYYRGPIESARGLDIMRWCLQSIGLFMVHYSIRCEQISLTFVLILIATKWISLPGVHHYILTRGWIPYRFQAYFRGPRFITMEDYEKEAIQETARALKELREYCESPECNTWRTVSRLKSPKRFASFMSDGVDVTSEERQIFDETSFDCAPFLTSDEDSENELALGEL